MLEVKGLFEVGRRGSPPECLIAAVEADPLEPHADVGIAAKTLTDLSALSAASWTTSSASAGSSCIEAAMRVSLARRDSTHSASSSLVSTLTAIMGCWRGARVGPNDPPGHGPQAPELGRRPLNDPCIHIWSAIRRRRLRV